MSRPEGAELDSRVAPVNMPSTCYHEAGHCAIAWHYGFEVLHVSVRPSSGDGYTWGGHTMLADRGEITTVAGFEREMRFAAAGFIATRRFSRPSDAELAHEFARYADFVEHHPDHSLDDDLIFAKMGLARDEELRNTNTAAARGPAAWVPVWREARRLVAVELWPAVKALASDLMVTTRDLGNSEVTAICTAAMLRAVVSAPKPYLALSCSTPEPARQ